MIATDLEASSPQTLPPPPPPLSVFCNPNQNFTSFFSNLQIVVLATSLSKKKKNLIFILIFFVKFLLAPAVVRDHFCKWYILQRTNQPYYNKSTTIL